MNTEPTNPEHPSDQDLYLHAAGDEPLRPEAERHVAGCDECRARLDGLRAVIASLEELPSQSAVSPGLTERLRQEIRPSAPVGRETPHDVRSRWGHPVLHVAAALAIFAAGLVVGARGQGMDPPAVAGEVRTLDVQRAGTNYVASLASLAAESAELSPREQRQLREVTLAAMSGAAFELRRLAGDDPVTAELYRATRAAWLGDPSGLEEGEGDR